MTLTQWAGLLEGKLYPEAQYSIYDIDIVELFTITDEHQTYYFPIDTLDMLSIDKRTWLDLHMVLGDGIGLWSCQSVSNLKESLYYMIFRDILLQSINIWTDESFLHFSSKYDFISPEKQTETDAIFVYNIAGQNVNKLIYPHSKPSLGSRLTTMH